jgi:membrane protease YdiL (CAAX protease family)
MPHVTLEHTPVNRNRVRWQIILYVIATYSITYFLAQYLFVWTPASARKLANKAREWWPFILMWLPGLTAFLLRFLFRQGFHDVGWQLGKRKFWAWAVGGPFLVISLVHLCAYLVGIVRLSPNISHNPLWQGIAEWFRIPWPDWTPDSTTARFLIKLGVVGTLVLAESFAYALGEELGWRGYLQTRLVESDWRFPLLLCGLIWAGWHFPFLWVIWDGYSPESIARAFLFTLSIAFAGVFIGWLRLASGSVWVAAIMHAAHNAFFGFYTLTFQGGTDWLWVSEAGIFTALAYGSLAFWLLRSGKVKAAKELSAKSVAA